MFQTTNQSKYVRSTFEVKEKAMITMENMNQLIVRLMKEARCQDVKMKVEQTLGSICTDMERKEEDTRYKEKAAWR